MGREYQSLKIRELVGKYEKCIQILEFLPKNNTDLVLAQSFRELVERLQKIID